LIGEKDDLASVNGVIWKRTKMFKVVIQMDILKKSIKNRKNLCHITISAEDEVQQHFDESIRNTGKIYNWLLLKVFLLHSNFEFRQNGRNSFKNGRIRAV
jgi:hypothetical protein